MDVYARCGGQIGTIRLRCAPTDSVAELKRRLAATGGPAVDLVMSHAGVACPEWASLGSLVGVASSSCFLDVQLRLRGGGGDGGSTGAESRASYLEMYAKKKPDKVNPEEEALARWTTCRLSGERLAPPLCADELGSLYNKSAVVAALVAKAVPASLSHISSLRHLIDLRPEPSTSRRAGSNSTDAGTFQMNNGADFMCPLTGLPMNGRYRFFAFRRSGLVVSEKALKEVPSAVEELLGGKWKQEDLLPLNGSAQEVQALRERMLLARAAAKARKEVKRAAAGTPAKMLDAETGPEAAANNSAGQDANGKRSAPRADMPSLADEKAHAKRFKAAEVRPVHASDKVWASIFTSSRPEAKETYGCRALSSRGLA